MAEAASSKQMPVQAATPADEESRAYLQARLGVMSRLMFGSFAVLIAFIAVIYEIYPDTEPHYNKVIYAISAIGIVLLVVQWRWLLLRRKLSVRRLQTIDVVYTVGTGIIFGAAGVLAYDLRSSAYLCVTWAALLVLLRAIVVPSTGRRTAVVSAVTCLPMIGATIALAVVTEQDVPGPAYVAGGILLCTMAILLATVSSNILYGLRKQVNAAMQLGQYTLVSLIRGGGHGMVYRARHAMLRRPTAIKLMLPDRIDPETLDRFEREVQHMSQLTHANTVAVFDYGRSQEGILYYAMEYLDGLDLQQLVQRFGRQPPDRVVGILVQVCGALEEAHRRGLIHRDIKPGNIILCERGDVPDVAKVVDFGLVKEIAGDTTRTHQIIGTPAFIAPESITDPNRVGPATDLYSLGAVGYYLLTGKLVFDGATSVDTCVKHVSESPIPPSELVAVPAALEAIVLRCLAKQPEQRPRTAAALAAELRAIATAATWSEADAQEWWAAFRKQPPAPQIDARTITIDIGSRSTNSFRPEPRT